MCSTSRNTVCGGRSLPSSLPCASSDLACGVVQYIDLSKNYECSPKCQCDTIRDDHRCGGAARMRTVTLRCIHRTGASIGEPNPMEVAEEEERYVHMLDLSVGCEYTMDVDEGNTATMDHPYMAHTRSVTTMCIPMHLHDTPRAHTSGTTSMYVMGWHTLIRHCSWNDGASTCHIMSHK